MRLVGIVNLSDFMAISVIPMAAMLLILGSGSSRFRPENERILVKLTVPSSESNYELEDSIDSGQQELDGTKLQKMDLSIDKINGSPW